ncbi:MAG: hypothetical protein ACRBN8_08790 [Nannocystales bacterium]
MTSERSAVLRPGVLGVLALVAFGCPQRSEKAEPTAPGHIVVDVFGAAEFVTVGCGESSSRILVEDLSREVGRCHKLASTPITQGRVVVNSETPYSAVFPVASVLHNSSDERDMAVVIDQSGTGSVPFRPWDVCYATTPTQACTHVVVEVLRMQMALKTWSGHVGPCASPRKRAGAYADRADATVGSSKAELACDVESVGTTAAQLAAVKARAKEASEDEPSCSVGTVSVHHDVSWGRVAEAIGEVRGWTGEVPALSAIPAGEAGLLGCEEGG